MNKQFIRTTLVSLCFFMIQSIYGQENFKSGYIIDQKGDTIKGLIDYRNWGVNPKMIIFKKSMEDQNISYSPLDIKKFGVESEIYEGAIVNIDKSSIVTENLSKKAEIEYQRDTIFLQTLIGGEKNLFFYRDFNKKTYFIIKQGDTFDYLVYKIYEKVVNGSPSIAYNKRYIGQLTVYLQDCPKIKDKIAKTSYTQKGLISLFNEYNKCTNREITFKKTREKLKFEFGAIAGLSLTKLKLSGGSTYALPPINFSISKDISLGLSLNIILPRNQGKWSINNELMYTHYKVDGRGEIPNSYGEILKSYKSFEFSYIKMTNMLRFKYPIKNIHLFCNAGISTGYAIEGTSYLEENSVTLGVVHEYYGKLLYKTRKFEYGANFGLGIAYNKLSFETRYEMTNGFSAYSQLFTNVNRLFFIVGYRF